MTQNPLGKSTQYVSHYAPELLFSIARSEKRDELNKSYASFSGQDIWNAYELSWLNNRGLPQVAIGEFKIGAESEFIVESKSLKLYLNSLNQTHFNSLEQVQETITNDLSRAVAAPVEVTLYRPEAFAKYQISQLPGVLIDDSDIKIDDYCYNPSMLVTELGQKEVVEETLLSHLLKSNCLITSQPDWASIQIHYQGPKINHDALLRYLVSFRSHNEFHEQCVERIFADIKQYCRADKLTVYARYTRRGGLDINPWRSDFETQMPNLRLARQ